MKTLLGYCLLASLLIFSFPASARWIASASPETVYQQALSASRQGNFSLAIRQIKNAERLFNAQGNTNGAYRSASLELYFRRELQGVRNRGHAPNPSWMRIGWLLKNHRYSGTYMSPTVPSRIFQGLLVLTWKVRDIPQGPGRSAPVWGVADAKTIPKLLPGEELLGGTCALKGKGFNPEIAAIAMVKGFQDREKFTKIRKAWRLNPRSNKIEIIPSQNVYCINEGLGV